MYRHKDRKYFRHVRTWDELRKYANMSDTHHLEIGENRHNGYIVSNLDPRDRKYLTMRTFDKDIVEMQTLLRSYGFMITLEGEKDLKYVKKLEKEWEKDERL